MAPFDGIVIASVSAAIQGPKGAYVSPWIAASLTLLAMTALSLSIRGVLRRLGALT